MRHAAKDDGIVYQGAAYEGLTCDFLGLLYSAAVRSFRRTASRRRSTHRRTRKVLDFMVKGVKDGTAANGVTTYMEEESRRYWESGKATFMRNWPYAYALGNKAPAIKGKFKITSLPGIDEARRRRARRDSARDQHVHRQSWRVACGAELLHL